MSKGYRRCSFYGLEEEEKGKLAELAAALTSMFDLIR